jgi:hypothetical protein
MGDDRSDGVYGIAPFSGRMDVESLLSEANNPCVATQTERLRRWFASGVKMLDLRDADKFAAARFENSVNMPLTDLPGRLHELPPRTTALVVLLARPGNGNEANPLTWMRKQLARFAADFKNNPWHVTQVFVTNPGEAGCGSQNVETLFASIALAADVPVLKGEVAPKLRGHLWEPSAMVVKWLPMIEEKVQAAAKKAAPAAKPQKILIDLGCGAGRDAVWAALRGWHVLALDSDAKGLGRCAGLAATHGVSDFVECRLVDLNEMTPGTIVAAAFRFAETRFAIVAASTGLTSMNGTLNANPALQNLNNPHITVLAVRFMNRGILKALPGLLPPGSVVCWFHFLRGAELTPMGRPNKAKDLLERNELFDTFTQDASLLWDVLCDRETQIPDGRPVSEFVAARGGGLNGRTPLVKKEEPRLAGKILSRNLTT